MEFIWDFEKLFPKLEDKYQFRKTQQWKNL